MEQLNEKNLRSGILRDLIDPSIDIDMHTPKIQDDSIVVVMRVIGNYDAGYDLSSFVEKLPFDILDTEVQEVPNSDNMYEIFMEFERNEAFPDNLMKMIDSVQALGEEIHFMANFYQEEEPQELDVKSIEQHVRLVPDVELKEFMEMSLSKVLVEKHVTLQSQSHRHSMVFDNVQRIDEEQASELVRKGFEFISESSVIFGNQYAAVRVSEGILVERDGKLLLFK